MPRLQSERAQLALVSMRIVCQKTLEVRGAATDELNILVALLYNICIVNYS